tara:strand:- start:411 stop:923 length:513 start_codon:yes stop_codon:yes gene_type:complete
MSTLKVGTIQSTTANTSMNISTGGIITYPNQIAFAATSATSQTITNATWTKVNLTNVELNRGNAYSSVNSRFTPPVDGIYHFTTIGNFETTTSPGGYIYFAIRKNGTVELYTSGMRLTSQAIQDDTQLNGGYMLELTTSDYVEMWGYCAGPSSTASFRGSRNKFQGFLVG